MFGVFHYYLHLCFGQIPWDTWNNVSQFTAWPPSSSCPLSLGSVQCSAILSLDHLRTFYCSYSKRHLWHGEITINSCSGAQTSSAWMRTVEINVPFLPSPALFLNWWHPAAVPHLYRDGVGLKEGKQYSLFPRLPKEINDVSCEDHSITPGILFQLLLLLPLFLSL